MLLTEAERAKIIEEIHTISNKVAQDQYIERLKQVVHDVKIRTGADLTDKLLPKKTRFENSN